VLTALRGRQVTATAALVALLAASALLRTRALDAGYWIDEGLSVGIAGHPLGDLPSLLLQDGSPPLYYALLHIWMSLFGDGEAATRTLSLLAALAAVPAALWAGRALFGARAGWAAAAITATAPLLTVYAQETRMYALLALLSILACGAFVRAFVHGSRPALVGFAVLALLLAYTHNWGLYLLAGFACALPIAARARGTRPVLRDAALVAVPVAIGFAPWIPTLLDQAAHTGAPWSIVPGPLEIAKPATVQFGEGLLALIALVAGSIGLARVRRPEVAALAAALVAGALLAWLGAQIEPGWADRYMNAFTGPVVLLVGAGLAAAGRAGLVALGAVVLLGALDAVPAEKSNARDVARTLAPGDAVVVTHPEQIAVLSHYAPDGVRWATPLGPSDDPSVFDWRRAEPRLRVAEPRPVLDALLAGGGARRIVVLRPRGNAGPIEAPWRAAVARATSRWTTYAQTHPRLEFVSAVPPTTAPVENRTDVQALTYRIRVP
jgi:hypothetical protein